MNMKKHFSIGLTLLLVLSVIGCGKEMVSEEVKQDFTQNSEVPAGDSGGPKTVTDNTDKDNNILIVYFSAANLNDVDAVTSATPLIDGASSVEWMANVIQKKAGGDVVKIIPSEDYPLSYQDVADAAKKEADDEVRPAIQPLSVDPTDYQTIFIGYPVWWYRMPMVMETFFDTYDLTGKTIIPFNTHEGSRDGGTYNMIRDRESGATVLDGFDLRGGKAGESSAEKEMEEWLNGLDL